MSFSHPLVLTLSSSGCYIV